MTAPEPNTWREVLSALDAKQHELSLDGRRVAVQEYGASNPDLLAGLEARGARVTRVPVYQWALPEDLAPLEAGVRAIADGQVDVVLFTTATQVVHLLKVAETMGLRDAVRSGLKHLRRSPRSGRRRRRSCASRGSSPTSNRRIPRWDFWCARPPSGRGRYCEGNVGAPERGGRLQAARLNARLSQSSLPAVLLRTFESTS